MGEDSNSNPIDNEDQNDGNVRSDREDSDQDQNEDIDVNPNDDIDVNPVLSYVGDGERANGQDTPNHSNSLNNSNNYNNFRYRKGKKNSNNSNNNNNNNRDKKTRNGNTNTDKRTFENNHNRDNYESYNYYARYKGLSNATFFPTEHGKGLNSNNSSSTSNFNIKTNNNSSSNSPNLITTGNMSKYELMKKMFTILMLWLGLKRSKYDVLDSFVLRFHHHLGAAYFFFCFFLIWCNVHIKEPLFCINQSAEQLGSKPNSSYLKNICLSYSFYLMPDGKKKWLLFYRWSHFSCLIVSLAYLVLKLLVKRFGNPRIKHLFDNIKNMCPRIDAKREHEQISTFMEYFKQNFGTHNALYHMYLFNHYCAFGISLLNFWFLDFVLQGDFMKLTWNVFPFKRDPVNFQDPLSLVFPPFVTCIIGPSIKMLNMREDTIQCHFTLMEILEKTFVFAWFYLVVALGISGISVIFLMSLPIFKKFILRTKDSSLPYRKLSEVLANNLSFGDVFLLWLAKSHFTEKEFCKILIEIFKFLKADTLIKEN